MDVAGHPAQRLMANSVNSVTYDLAGGAHGRGASSLDLEERCLRRKIPAAETHYSGNLSLKIYLRPALNSCPLYR